jgi:hypothetical protein
MKKVLLIPVILFCSVSLAAQNCDMLLVNLKKGTINGLKPTATQEKVKEKLPCFTGDTEDGSNYNCGGGVFFLNHDFYFYTGNDYIELRSKFNGTVSAAVLGLTEEEAVKNLKMGKAVRVEKNETDRYLFFKTGYGCVVLTITGSSVKKIAMYQKPATKVSLCL